MESLVIISIAALFIRVAGARWPTVIVVWLVCVGVLMAGKLGLLG